MHMKIEKLQIEASNPYGTIGVSPYLSVVIKYVQIDHLADSFEDILKQKLEDEPEEEQVVAADLFL